MPINASFLCNDGTVYDATIRKRQNKYYRKIDRIRKEPVNLLPVEIITQGGRMFLTPSETITEGSGTYSPTTHNTSLFDTFQRKVVSLELPVGFYIEVNGSGNEPSKYYRYIGNDPTSLNLKAVRYTVFTTQADAQRFLNKILLLDLYPCATNYEEIDEAVHEFKRRLETLGLKLFYNEDEGALQVLRNSVYTTTKNDYDETDPRFKDAVKVPEQLFYSLDLDVTYTRNNDEQFAVQAFFNGNPKDKEV